MANTHDKLALEPLVRGIAPIRSRRGPRRRRPAKLHGDKGYDYADLRRWLRGRGITPRIARRGIESSDRLGRYRWVVKRTVSWPPSSVTADSPNEMTSYCSVSCRWDRERDCCAQGQAFKIGQIERTILRMVEQLSDAAAPPRRRWCALA